MDLYSSMVRLFRKRTVLHAGNNRQQGRAVWVEEYRMNRIVFAGNHAKGSDNIWHVHEQWEFIYCTEGEVDFRFDGNATMSCQKGDVIVIPPMLQHITREREMSAIHIKIADPSFTYSSPFKVTDIDGTILVAFQQAKTYYLSGAVNKDLIISALGDLIVGYMIVHRSNSRYSEIVSRVSSMILRNYTSAEFELDEYLHSLPFHYDYTRKLFKKEMGMSPLEFLITLRMKNAEQLLMASWPDRYSVAEVAEMCGYSDPLYFSRVFKKYFGLSPKKYIMNSENSPLDGDE